MRLLISVCRVCDLKVKWMNDFFVNLWSDDGIRKNWYFIFLGIDKVGLEEFLEGSGRSFYRFVDLGYGFR